MTTLFEALYSKYLNYYTEATLITVPTKVMGMYNNIKDLPEVAPYGFWIDKSGNFAIVGSMLHEEVGEHILTKASEYLNNEEILRMMQTDGIYGTMFKFGFVRVQLAKYNMTVYWENGSGERLTTPAQQRFLEHIRTLYNFQRIQKDR